MDLQKELDQISTNFYHNLTSQITDPLIQQFTNHIHELRADIKALESEAQSLREKHDAQLVKEGLSRVIHDLERAIHSLRAAPVDLANILKGQKIRKINE